MRPLDRHFCYSVIILTHLFIVGGAKAGVALPTDYSAQLIHSARGKTMIQQLYVKGTKMRSVIQAQGTDFVTLLDKQAGIVTALDGKSKTFTQYPYREVSNPSVIDFELVNDPEAKVEELGSGVVDGVECKKRKITANRGVIIYWTDSKTQLPVRMQSVDETIQIDWKKVAVGPIEDSLFEIPKDFTKKS